MNFYDIFSSSRFFVLEIAKKDEMEEEEEEDQIGTSDEELEEDVFRKRKAELTSHAGRLPCRMNSHVAFFLTGVVMKSGGLGLKPE